MSSKEKFAVVAAMISGAVAGFQFWGIAGAVVGFFAGLGALSVVWLLADEADSRLAEHYRRV